MATRLFNGDSRVLFFSSPYSVKTTSLPHMPNDLFDQIGVEVCLLVGWLPKILRFPLDISTTVKASDFKFGTEFGFEKGHYKITPRVFTVRYAAPPPVNIVDTCECCRCFYNELLLNNCSRLSCTGCELT